MYVIERKAKCCPSLEMVRRSGDEHSRLRGMWGRNQVRESTAYNICKENVLFKVLNTVTRMNLIYSSWYLLQD
jgi:hypothetical protein